MADTFDVTDLWHPVEVVEVGIVSGPKGDPGQWVAMTLAQFNALSPKDPATLYIIIP